MKPYEIIEHTADIGLKIHGNTLEELFVHAAEGLFDLTVEMDKIKTAEGKTTPELVEHAVTFRLQGVDLGDLFHRWLRELLYVFSTERLIFHHFDCKLLTEDELEVVAKGNPFDPKVHEQKNEVKAVTYHDFKVEKGPSGWTAQVIFDI